MLSRQSLKIFVYGTLLKGMCRSLALDNSKFEDHGYIHADLYDLGHYPAILTGSSKVFGEIYSVNQDTVEHLDQIEGYYLDDIEGSLYIRQEVVATMLSDGSSEFAQVYFYNDLIDNSKFILCGDYRRYLVERSADHQLYLAYGSNMSSLRLTARVGTFEHSFPGHLEGYQLVFNKAGANGSTYANIVYRGEGYHCPYVAYRVTKNQLNILDRHEGEPDDYVRIVIPFHDLTTGDTRFGHVYIANPNRLSEQLNISNEYLGYIFDGYRAHGFNTSCLPQ